MVTKSWIKAKGLMRRLAMEKLKSFGNEAPLKGLRFTFCEQNSEMAQVLADVFATVSAVEVLHGDLLKLNADALVSPANSFGEMSGGIDQAIDNFYQGEAQEKAIKLIQTHYYGELPVGNAHILTMENQQYPKLILAPTMRIPGRLAGNAINAYLAMRAVLISILDYNQTQHDHIEHVVMSSLCTGVGRMPYLEAAEQLLVAYENIVNDRWKSIIHPAIAPYANRI